MVTLVLYANPASHHVSQLSLHEEFSFSRWWQMRGDTLAIRQLDIATRQSTLVLLSFIDSEYISQMPEYITRLNPLLSSIPLPFTNGTY